MINLRCHFSPKLSPILPAITPCALACLFDRWEDASPMRRVIRRRRIHAHFLTEPGALDRFFPTAKAALRIEDWSEAMAIERGAA